MARGGTTCWAPIALAACNSREDSRPASAQPPRAIDPLDAVRLDDKPLDWAKPIAKGERDLSGYAGNESCKRCHEQIYASYQKHSMARTGMRRIASVDQAWIGKIFDAATSVKHERSGFAYRPVRRGRQYFVEEILSTPAAARSRSGKSRSRTCIRQAATDSRSTRVAASS